MNFSIRNNIESLKKSNMWSNDVIFEVGKHKWSEILIKIEKCFTEKVDNNGSLMRAWETFKEPRTSFDIPYEKMISILESILHEEKLWLVVEDIHLKFWLYEISTSYLSDILGSIESLGEYYLISKKFEFIICENHHSIFLVSGEVLIDEIVRELDTV